MPRTSRPIMYRSCTAAVIGLLLVGCQSVPMLPGLAPYQIDVQQGNVVTQEMVSKLKPGMSRQQVRFVLGTPPIVDPFRTDRWDYVYFYNKSGRITEHRRLVLLFENDTLKRIEGDVIPGDGGASGEANRTARGNGAVGSNAQPQSGSESEEKGFFGRMLDRIGF